MGFCGAALGAAATGLRPVVEIMFVEFLGVALDMLVTEAAKLRYLSGGAYTAPLVIRASVGAGLGFGTQHSQTLETWMYACPGLKLATPSGAGSAYGLLRSAIRDEDPVVILEPRGIHAEHEEVTLGPDGLIPLGVADIRRTGDDVTIVSLGQTVRTALTAADGAPWTAGVIDLRTLIPWDRERSANRSSVRASRPGRGESVLRWLGNRDRRQRRCGVLPCAAGTDRAVHLSRRAGALSGASRAAVPAVGARCPGRDH